MVSVLSRCTLEEQEALTYRALKCYKVMSVKEGIAIPHTGKEAFASLVKYLILQAKNNHL